MNVAVLGAGGWGTTLSLLLLKKGYQVSLWEAFPEYASLLKRRRKNVKFLPDIPLPSSLFISSELEEVVPKAEALIFVVPSFALRNIAKRAKNFFSTERFVLSATKGLERETGLRMSQILKEVLGTDNLAVLSGPTIAKELVKGTPTAAVVASQREKVSKYFQSLLFSDKFRIYTGSDPVGVELGGALKNIIAIAAGIVDGLNLGANTKGALLTRGLAEIQRLGTFLGADPRTFQGLSGFGDLVTTSISKESRNRSFGEEIGKGERMDSLISKTEMVIEGIGTTEIALTLAKRENVEMPITQEVYNILFKDRDPLETMNELMKRKEKREI